MPPNAPEDLSRTIETLYRSESGRILATLVRLLGDLDIAEEAMHEAFAAALDRWPQAGIPDKPRPWLISTARFKAIDGMRRRARFDGAQRDLALYIEARINEAPQEDSFEISLSRLRTVRLSLKQFGNLGSVFLRSSSRNEPGLDWNSGRNSFDRRRSTRDDFWRLRIRPLPRIWQGRAHAVQHLRGPRFGPSLAGLALQ